MAKPQQADCHRFIIPVNQVSGRACGRAGESEASIPTAIRAIPAVDFLCEKINMRRNFTPSLVYETGLLESTKLQNSPQTRSPFWS
ncbi:MAG TPA: hypothetical protein VHL30_02900, partial [Chlamydiales bacterium]|nr:hypothetical protein [Chlamydiales bacterium]